MVPARHVVSNVPVVRPVVVTVSISRYGLASEEACKESAFIRFCGVELSLAVFAVAPVRRWHAHFDHRDVLPAARPGCFLTGATFHCSAHFIDPFATTYIPPGVS